MRKYRLRSCTHIHDNSEGISLSLWRWGRVSYPKVRETLRRMERVLELLNVRWEREGNDFSWVLERVVLKYHLA